MLDRGAHEMLINRFPNLEIVFGDIGENDELPSNALGAAIERADFLIHGSGPYVVAIHHIEAWVRLTSKPYGIYGVTIDPLVDSSNPQVGSVLTKQYQEILALPSNHISERLRRVLEQAAFVYCRDSLSLKYLELQKVKPPTLEFAPDGAFGIDLRNEAKTDVFLAEHGLRDGEFICLIPRLRFTPYDTTHGVESTPVDKARAAISERYRDSDLDKIKVMVTSWVRATGLKVLICPEMTYQIELGRLLCGEHLPEDVRSHVIRRNQYWLPDEACSTYARAHTVVSMDNHTPIFALATGVPTLFIRQPSDTIKGQMWLDLGMDSWFFEIDVASGEQLADALLDIHADRNAALTQVSQIMEQVRDKQAQTMAYLNSRLAKLRPTERV